MCPRLSRGLIWHPIETGVGLLVPWKWSLQVERFLHLIRTYDQMRPEIGPIISLFHWEKMAKPGLKT